MESKTNPNLMDVRYHECSKWNDKYGNNVGMDHGGGKERQDVKPWRVVWHEFVDSTTFHGIRYIFIERSFLLRRILWILLTLGCGGVMSFQIIDRIIYYGQSPVNVNVKINYNQSLNFPAITVCNQNTFKASVAMEKGWYNLIEDIYNNPKFSADHLEYYGATNLTLQELFEIAGHRKEDLIVSCSWDKEYCGAVNFTTVLTDHGLCYKFIAPHLAKATGADHGLTLLLNVEQYEYMPGPNNAAGVKVLTHSVTEHPRVRELGLSIPTGTQAYVGFQLYRLNNLPKPYGECSERKLFYFDDYNYDSCKAECFVKDTKEKCHCRDYYMPNRNNDPPACTLEQYFSCLKPMSEQKSDLEERCDCPTACKSVLFDPVMSYAKTSQYAAEKLLDNVDLEILREKVYLAREVTNRMEAKNFNSFKNQVTRVQDRLNDIKNLVLFDIHRIFREQYDLMNQTFIKTEEAWERREVLYKYQIYNVQKNFMRGRDAMEERTFGHLCTSLFEFAFMIETNLRNLASPNITNDLMRDMFYIGTKDFINTRVENALRALDNYTRLYDAYRNGTPIFRYKFRSIPRSYNIHIVPSMLLNESTYHNSYAIKYTPRLGTDIQKIINSLRQYDDLLSDVHQTSELNVTTMQKISKTFTTACKNYYHAKSVMYIETIDRPERILKSQLEYFENLKLELVRSQENVLHNLGNLDTGLQGLMTTSFANVSDILHRTEQYFLNTSITKLSLAELFLSEIFISDINSLRLFFQEVRSRGQNIYDGWMALGENMKNIWSTILKDDNVHEYYSFTNDSEFLQNFSDVSFAIETNVTEAQHRFDLRFIIQDKDILFFKDLDDVTNALTSYSQSLEITEDLVNSNFLQLDLFYRQLSYEEITQQVAYDIFSLLCDIGGSMGLFVGASVLTMFELVDLFSNFAADRLLRSSRQMPNRI